MKFMTISKIKEVYYTLPKAELAKIGLARIEFMLEYKKKRGDKWHCYYDPGMSQIITIGEYDSIDEYSQSLNSTTAAAGYTDHQSIPLLEADQKMLETYLKQTKAAM